MTSRREILDELFADSDLIELNYDGLLQQAIDVEAALGTISMTPAFLIALLRKIKDAPEVTDCLVFLHNTRGRFPSYNVVDWLPEPLRHEIAAEAARREEEA